MKINNIQQYNQKLLAILGTLVLVVILVYAVIGGIVVGSELIGGDGDYQDNALTISDSESLGNGQERVIRDQALSFGRPRLIDTLGAVYIIPVSQVNLENSEEVLLAKEEFGLLNTFSKGSRYYHFEGYFNNVICYDQKTDERYPLFKEQIVITEFEAHQIGGHFYLFLQGASRDSNQDKKLDEKDLKALYIYDFDKNELDRYGYEHMGLDWYYLTNDMTELMMAYAQDSNEDGIIDRYQEPSIIKKMNLNMRKVEDLIDNDLKLELQQLID